MIPELVRKKWSERFNPFSGINASSLFAVKYFDNHKVEPIWNVSVMKRQIAVSTTPQSHSVTGESEKRKLHLDEYAGSERSDIKFRKDAVEKNELKELTEIGAAVSAELKKNASSFGLAERETSPLFEGVGRDLQSISHETSALTETVKQFAQRLNSDGKNNSSLDGVKQLIVDVAQSLQRDHQGIENDLQHVGSLRHSLSDVRSMYEIMDTISSSFRVVRINIQIQCNTNAISDNLFQGLVEDITSLSQRMDRIARQISKDLFASERNMSSLNITVSENLGEIKQVSELAETSITKAFKEIERLIQSAMVMMEEAGVKSRTISGKVGEVVVSLQFHDSMSQRLEEIGRGIDNACELLRCNGEKLTPGHLGTAFLILDVHFRQLEKLISELGSVRSIIEQSFEDLGKEVGKLSSVVKSFHGKGIDQKDFISHSSSLQQDIPLLLELFSRGSQMKKKIHASAVETQGISSRMGLFAEEMQDIQGETKLQAVNTIIMACSLGDKGKTIEVLAKEISTLSDQTSLLTDDVTTIQETMNGLLVKLANSSTEEQGGTNVIDLLVKELEQFCDVYGEIDNNVEELSEQIENTSEKISRVSKNLSFLAELEGKLVSFCGQVKSARDRLEPWQGKELGDDSKSVWLKDEYTSVLETATWMGNDTSRTHNSHSEDNTLLFDEKITGNQKNSLLIAADESDRKDLEMDGLEDVEFF